MSFDLVVLPADRARTGEGVAKWIEQADHGVEPHVDEAAALRSLADELGAAFSSGSPSAPPANQPAAVNVESGHLVIEIAWSAVASVAAVVLASAARHRLAVYDPQSDRLFGPDDERPATSEWANASLPFDAIVNAIEQGGPPTADPRLVLESPDPRLRAQTALGMGWASDADSLDGLRHALAYDSDAQVRAMAAQSLMLRGDASSVRAIASFVHDMAATGERDSLDAARIAAVAVVQSALHGSMGFVPRMDAGLLQEVRDAVATVAAVADRLRSRHRGEFQALVATLDEVASS